MMNKLLLLPLVLTLHVAAAAGATYDLSSNWSNTLNPNGPWGVNVGAIKLPSVANWNGDNTTWSTSCDQPAWAPTNASGDFLPAWMQVNACAAKYFPIDPNNTPTGNVLAGDIVVHTNDGGNGNLALGSANLVFTVPASAVGTYVITGAFWSARLADISTTRPQDWQVTVNGAVVGSGVLNSSVSRSKPETLNVTESLGAGTIVQLTIAMAAGATAGDFVGVQLTLTPTSGPAITSGGIVPVYSSSTTIEPGSWISIYGTNLASSPETWKGDFPTMLGNTSVTIDGEPAFLWYVSPLQINLQAPDDMKSGPVAVTVTTPAGTATSTVTLGPFGPSLSLLDGKHIAGIILRRDGSGAYGSGSYDIIGPTGSSLGYPTVAAKAGDSLELFGVGFGPTNPFVRAGAPYSGAAPATNSVQLLINGMTVLPNFSGITAAGLFQFNIGSLPAGLGTGDVPIQGVVAGVQSPTGAVISLQ
jgi:uncharacterized protein (TIGR03437 family)